MQNPLNGLLIEWLIFRETAIVGDDHYLHLNIKIPESFLNDVDVLIIPKLSKSVSEMEFDQHEFFNEKDDLYCMEKLQMQSNFVKKELADPAEDVWNDYL